MQLYTFFPSGSAYRVRIALALKEIDYEPVYVVGGRGGGHGASDLKKPEYLALNPSAVVPTLVDSGHVLTQTIPIMEYLEETHPGPALLPKDPPGRGRVRAMAHVMVSDTHSLGTARVMGYLDETLGLAKEAADQWLRFWNERGFGALEKMLAGNDATGAYCHGDTPGMADICLVAHVFAAEKLGVDLAAFTEVQRITQTCMALAAFADTHPSKQPDNPANQ